MFGEALGLVAVEQRLEPVEVVDIEWRLAAQRQPDAMDRQRVALTDAGQIVVVRAAGHQVVFGMDLKKADVGPVADDPLKMVGLQAHARACRQAVHGLFSKGEAVRQWWL